MGCGGSKAVSTVQVQPSKSASAGPTVNRQQFVPERLIGQGGFGRVDAVTKVRGFDQGSKYAMKTLTKAVVLERGHVGMVMKERNLLARLHCPQLVNMHYAFQDERNLYIVMDLCLGGDLHYQLSQQPQKCFSEEQTRMYVAEIILCLEYMHAAGILHRDIKPENLLLDDKGFVKVTDLGVSSEVGEDGVCTATSGTRPYMAPEVFMSGHRHSFVSDFYSLGITAFQMLTGQRPYKPETANLKAIVRMSTFIPPEKYTDLRQIRRILVNAQERKAPSTEFRYSQALSRFSHDAREFVQLLLICNPKYRLGSEGVHELRGHAWFDGLDWEALAGHNLKALFVPDISRTNCSVGTADAAALALDSESSALAPPIPAAEQVKFKGYDYRVGAIDASSGRGERIPYAMPASSTGNGSLGPDSMRQPTVSHAQHAEVLSNASVANYNGGSMNYRLGDSLIYQLPQRDGGLMPSSSPTPPGGSLVFGAARSQRPPNISTRHASNGGGGGSMLYASLGVGATPGGAGGVVSPASPHAPVEHLPHGAQREKAPPLVIAVAAAAGGGGGGDGGGDAVQLGGSGSPEQTSHAPQPRLSIGSPGGHPKSILKAPSQRISANGGPGANLTASSPRLVQVAAVGGQPRRAAAPYAVQEDAGSEPRSLAASP